MKKTRAIFAILCFSFLFAGCLGPNSTFNSLRNWNAKATGNKYANEAIFLGLNIVPVYSLSYLGDVLIFNSWEFWTGKSLWKSDPGGYPADAPK